MRVCVLGILLGVVTIAVATGNGARGDRGPKTGGGTFGPDIVASSIGFESPNPNSYENYGPVGGHRAYAFSTTACNIGTLEVSWRDGLPGPGDNRHPVIALNMFRLQSGRFEQIGQAWAKHGFCAVDGNDCGVCESNFDCDFLGVGCSDAYSASLNGSQTQSVGPKHEINAFTGGFPFPPDTSASIDDDTSRRLRVALADVQAGANPGARYFVEAQYVSSDEAVFGNTLNNASWREVTLDADGAVTGWASATSIGEPAILAWDANQQGVEVMPVDVPGEGRFFIGWRAAPAAGGMFSYEYAVFNLNSHRAGRSLAVPLPDGVSIEAIGFHDVDYHSGEPFDGTDWAITTGGSVEWSTQSFEDDPNANALRWGTQYNFRFLADRPPRESLLTLGLYRGPLDAVTFAGVAPTPPEDVNLDGIVDLVDLLEVLNAWGACGDCLGDVNDDGIVDVIDVLAVLGAWGQ